MNKPPLCDNDPEHGEMKHVILMQGDTVLGCCWFCTRDDPSKKDYCDGCADCDCTPPSPRQLSLIYENE